jgi:hypothetical protein
MGFEIPTEPKEQVVEIEQQIIEVEPRIEDKIVELVVVTQVSKTIRLERHFNTEFNEEPVISPYRRAVNGQVAFEANFEQEFFIEEEPVV